MTEAMAYTVYMLSFGVAYRNQNHNTFLRIKGF